MDEKKSLMDKRLFFRFLANQRKIDSFPCASCGGVPVRKTHLNRHLSDAHRPFIVDGVVSQKCFCDSTVPVVQLFLHLAVCLGATVPKLQQRLSDHAKKMEIFMPTVEQLPPVEPPPMEQLPPVEQEPPMEQQPSTAKQSSPGEQSCGDSDERPVKYVQKNRANVEENEETARRLAKNNEILREVLQRSSLKRSGEEEVVPTTTLERKRFRRGGAAAAATGEQELILEAMRQQADGGNGENKRANFKNLHRWLYSFMDEIFAKSAKLPQCSLCRCDFDKSSEIFGHTRSSVHVRPDSTSEGNLCVICGKEFYDTKRVFTPAFLIHLAECSTSASIVERKPDLAKKIRTSFRQGFDPFEVLPRSYDEMLEILAKREQLDDIDRDTLTLLAPSFLSLERIDGVGVPSYERNVMRAAKSNAKRLVHELVLSGARRGPKRLGYREDRDCSAEACTTDSTSEENTKHFFRNRDFPTFPPDWAVTDKREFLTPEISGLYTWHVHLSRFLDPQLLGRASNPLITHIFVFKLYARAVLSELLGDREKYFVLPNTCLCQDPMKKENVHRHVIVVFRDRPTLTTFRKRFSFVALQAAAKKRATKEEKSGTEEEEKTKKTNHMVVHMIRSREHFYYAIRYVSSEHIEYNWAPRRGDAIYDDDDDEDEEILIDEDEDDGENTFGCYKQARNFKDHHSATSRHFYIARRVCEHFSPLFYALYPGGLEDWMERIKMTATNLTLLLCDRRIETTRGADGRLVRRSVIKLGKLAGTLNRFIYEHALVDDGADRRFLASLGILVPSGDGGDEEIDYFQDFLEQPIRLPKHSRRYMSIFEEMMGTIVELTRTRTKRSLSNALNYGVCRDVIKTFTEELRNVREERERERDRHRQELMDLRTELDKAHTRSLEDQIIRYADLERRSTLDRLELEKRVTIEKQLQIEKDRLKRDKLELEKQLESERKCAELKRIEAEKQVENERKCAELKRIEAERQMEKERNSMAREKSELEKQAEKERKRYADLERRTLLDREEWKKRLEKEQKRRAEVEKYVAEHCK